MIPVDLSARIEDAETMKTNTPTPPRRKGDRKHGARRVDLRSDPAARARRRGRRVLWIAGALIALGMSAYHAYGYIHRPWPTDPESHRVPLLFFVRGFVTAAWSALGAGLLACGVRGGFRAAAPTLRLWAAVGFMVAAMAIIGLRDAYGPPAPILREKTFIPSASSATDADAKKKKDSRRPVTVTLTAPTPFEDADAKPGEADASKTEAGHEAPEATAP